MRRSICFLVLLLVIITTALALTYKGQSDEDIYNYKLVFFDDFKQSRLDTSSWNIMKRTQDNCWRYLSSHSSVIKHKRNYIRLYALYNNGIDKADTAKYLTAGISTQNKHTIKYGKIEVRARFHGAVASWPAIWLRGCIPSKIWPDPNYAEIDILEYPNRSDYVMQTVHNYYTMKLKKTSYPPHQALPKVDAERFNVYSVEILPDVIIFRVNGEETMRYPKIKTTDVGQFPFGCQSYLMMDMQVGASWLPKPDKESYPAYMDIDWVKMYDLIN